MATPFSGGTISNLVLTISADNLSANLDQIQQAVGQGSVISVTLSDAGTPDVVLTGAQILNDAAALNAIVTPYHPLVGVADLATAINLAGSRQNVDIIDTPAAVQAALSGIQKFASSVGTVFIAGGETPTLTIDAARLGDSSAALVTIAGSCNLRLSAKAAEVGNLALDTAPHITRADIVDLPSNVFGTLDALEALAHAGRLGSITLTAAAGSVLDLPPAQIEADAEVLTKLRTVSGLLTQVAQVTGTVLDFDGSRLLYSPSAVSNGINIRDISTNTDLTVQGPAGSSVTAGYLTPEGAYFVAGRLFEYSGGFLYNLGSLDSSLSPNVAGSYVEWSNGESLFEASTATPGVVTQIPGTYVNWQNDVATNGLVAAATSDGRVVTYAAGAVTTIAAPVNGRDYYVSTDGANFVYVATGAFNYAGSNFAALTLDRSGVMTPLLEDYEYVDFIGRFPFTHTPEVGEALRDFKVANGWVVFRDPNRSEFYELAPGATQRVEVSADVDSVVALADDGSVGFQTASGLKIAVPIADGGFAIYFVGDFANARKVGSHWYVWNTDEIYRFDLGSATGIRGAAQGLTVRGGSSSRYLLGGNDSDSLTAGSRFTVLYSGGGNDVLTGGALEDSFYLGAPGDGVTTIRGYETGIDHIDIDTGAYSQGGTFGFTSGAGSHPAVSGAYFFFDTATDYLWFDSGDAAAHPTIALAAYLPGVETLSASDLVRAEIAGEAGASKVVTEPNTTAYAVGRSSVLWGEAPGDVLVGGEFGSTLIAQAPDISLIADSSGGFLAGLGGNDRLFGSSGADTFYFNSPSAGVDTLFNYSESQGDKIAIEGSNFAAPSGFRFTDGIGLIQGAHADATMATATFAYETLTSYLWYDPDGTGAAVRTLVAFLPGGPVLHASDIVVA